MARLFTPYPSGTKVVTFTTSQAWTCPPGVTEIGSAVGKGQNGSPGTSGYYDPPVDRSAYVTSVSGLNSRIGTGVTPGTLYWDWCQTNGSNAVTNINGGGSGTVGRKDYYAFSNGWTQSTSTVSFSNSIPGSASMRTAGWKTSGAVVDGELGFVYVDWREYGAYNPGDPATVGASTTGFGKTWPGGDGGTAPTLTFTSIPVVPGQVYNLSIPSGGYITITYAA